MDTNGINSSTDYTDDAEGYISREDAKARRVGSCYLPIRVIREIRVIRGSDNTQVGPELTTNRH